MGAYYQDCVLNIAASKWLGKSYLELLATLSVAQVFWNNVKGQGDGLIVWAYTDVSTQQHSWKKKISSYLL